MADCQAPSASGSASRLKWDCPTRHAADIDDQFDRPVQQFHKPE
jgi:hypothetical protein